MEIYGIYQIMLMHVYVNNALVLLTISMNAASLEIGSVVYNFK